MAETRAADMWRDSIRKKTPADVKAVLTADLIQNASYAMTDYFMNCASRCVILGLSKHPRDNSSSALTLR